MSSLCTLILTSLGICATGIVAARIISKENLLVPGKAHFAKGRVTVIASIGLFSQVCRSGDWSLEQQRCLKSISALEAEA